MTLYTRPPRPYVSLHHAFCFSLFVLCNRLSLDKVSVLESTGPIIRVIVETSGQMVEVELLPMVEIPGCWPRKARWPRFFKRWPSKDRARCMKTFGFDLVARSNYHWQLSFLRVERLLLDGVDEDGGCRMKCLRVVRQLKEDVWCPGTRPVITSQHLQQALRGRHFIVRHTVPAVEPMRPEQQSLEQHGEQRGGASPSLKQALPLATCKMILLWECERNPSSKAWLDFGSCFLRLVSRLLKCSQQRFLRHYFVRRANLLKYADANQLDKLADNLSRFLQCPNLNLSPYCDNASVC
ncbi:unnamed protein product [Ranitomeya imitator]|uniref:Mab-21-like HhH/H2TH-like domain-containing protein n=1 Tax=Ranitomeya imitator TaxID=111125 RepID=A0ABN9LFK0_9NEOB|nr:unnamed protein product [Ranitomeya imitator]